MITFFYGFGFAFLLFAILAGLTKDKETLADRKPIYLSNKKKNVNKWK